MSLIIIEPTKKETAFITAYMEAIDFTECGDIDQPEHGAELDETFMRESVIDCLAFYSRIECYISNDNIEQSGHDFWLTRNGHGTGFWDRSKIYGNFYAEEFTKSAKLYGEVYAIFEEETVYLR
tara:strand:+ start:719 stop:1090 length:372 start_codon:yes stop_codon:yes gene_type:complete